MSYVAQIGDFMAGDLMSGDFLTWIHQTDQMKSDLKQFAADLRYTLTGQSNPFSLRFIIVVSAFMTYLALSLCLAPSPSFLSVYESFALAPCFSNFPPFDLLICIFMAFAKTPDLLISLSLPRFRPHHIHPISLSLSFPLTLSSLVVFLFLNPATLHYLVTYQI